MKEIHFLNKSLEKPEGNAFTNKSDECPDGPDSQSTVDNYLQGGVLKQKW